MKGNSLQAIWGLSPRPAITLIRVGLAYLLFIMCPPNVWPNAHAPADAEAGAKLYPVCTSCHGANGQGNVGMAGPKLTGLQGSYLLKQMQNFQSGARGMAAGDPKGRQMAAVAGVSRLTRGRALENLVAYIESLSDVEVAKTVVGDVLRGENLYNGCASCHAPSGQGIEAIGAPRLAGQNDWYLLAQLQHFAEGRRGYDPKDHGGRQMQRAMNELRNIDDYQAVIAYINTLTP